MKWILNAFCFFICATSQVFAVENESFEEDEWLTADQIDALDAWGETKKISIGSGKSRSTKASGVIVQKASFRENDKCLAGISFEKEDFSSSKKVVAERQVRSIGARSQ